MKHSGKALRAALKLIGWTLVGLLALFTAGVVGALLSSVIAAASTVLVALWLLFALFTLYFFRDPNPLAPTIPNAIVSPAHGKVDWIGETEEPEYMGGRCRRISIFLSVVDVHVQRAPVTGRVVYQQHHEGRFLSATRTDCSEFNENVLLGLEPSDYPQARVGLRLIAGLIARRILVWAAPGETVQRSERISLIQFGSRCDLYLPMNSRVHVKLGDRVKGGESIVASIE